MKWFFALSEASLSNDNLYADCIRVAVTSARNNTSLTPFFLYDGLENGFVKEMRSLGVNIIRHRAALYDHIVADKPDDQHFIRIASGAFLRVDIPIIEKDDEFVLYTDCDIMFLKDPNVADLRPKYFSVAPEFTRDDYATMNSGVMLINVPNMRIIYDEFIKFIRGYRISDYKSYDQRALRLFFKGAYDRLPETLNWKPYWGKSRDAAIIHFHGPKPPHVRGILNGAGGSLPPILTELYDKSPGYYQETVDIWYSCLAEAASRASSISVTADHGMTRAKFEHRAPSAQNAVDIFAGKWATNLSAVCDVTGTGQVNLFPDPRIQMAADKLGKNGRFDGVSILELGPLEAAHTYQLEQLGAEHVVAIESNTEAYLKCLTVKEILKLKSEFRCGDAVAYLKETDDIYGMILCSGILYHMADPVTLISLICQRAASCFVWTHYQSDDAIKQNRRKARPAISAGFETIYYESAYSDMTDGRFWGGNLPVSAWMTQAEIIRAFQHFGFSSSAVGHDHPDHPNGSAFSLAVWR